MTGRKASFSLPSAGAGAYAVSFPKICWPGLSSRSSSSGFAIQRGIPEFQSFYLLLVAARPENLFLMLLALQSMLDYPHSHANPPGVAHEPTELRHRWPSK